MMKLFGAFTHGPISPSLLGFISLISSAALVQKISVGKGPDPARLQNALDFPEEIPLLGFAPWKLIRSDLYLLLNAMNIGCVGESGC